MNSTAVQKETTQIRNSITALRAHFKGMSDLDIARAVLDDQKKSGTAANGKAPTKSPGKVTAEDDVLPFAKKEKRFSTSDVEKRFGVSSGSAAALVAILRIKKVIEPEGKDSDGVSRWRYTG